MLCILYVNAVGALLCVIGLLIERMLPAGIARRWIWCVTIPLSMAIPGFYRAHHTWTVTDMSAQVSAQQPISTTLGISTLTPFDRAWWARSESYDTTINQIWSTISAVLLIWGVANALRVALLVAMSRREEGNRRKPAIVDGVPVVVTDQLGPATVGLLRSRVLVPRWVLALPGIQRQYVVRHEDEHRRAHDAHLIFFASLPILLMPWNLAMWWQIRRLCLAVEMDCDNRVVAALGDAPAYGALLLTVAQAASRGPRLQPAFLGGMGSLERRLTALVAPAPLRRMQRFMLPALAVGLLFVVVWMPHPILGPHCNSSSTIASATTTTIK